MKKNYATLILFFLLLSAYSQNHEKYYVTSEKLNVRSQPIVNDINILYKIKKGSEINVKNIRNNWAEIELKNKNHSNGFVSSKFISKTYPIRNSSSKNSEKKQFNWFFWLSIIGGVVILYKIISSRYKKKCDNCGKWNTLKKIDTKIIEKIPTTIKKTLTDTIRNKKGDTIRTKTKEVVVPATKFRYRIFNKCKKCDQVYTHIETNTTEN